jgi:kelch-like protein 2/3
MLSECEKANINVDSICDDPLVTSIPPWKLVQPTVNLHLSSWTKLTTSSLIYQQAFLEQCSKYPGYEKIFTDGSLREDAVGAAAISEKDSKTPLMLRLPDGSSVYTAELRAILLALKRIYQSQGKKFLVVSDSLSALQAIVTRKISHPFLGDIHDLHTQLILDGKVIQFIWAPSHMGIRGNEMADQAAKEALDQPMPDWPIQAVPHLDLRKKSLCYIKKLWKDRWAGCRDNKLFQIKPSLDVPLSQAAKSRKEETILTRLRIGHTYITHGFLLRKEDPPWCHACDTVFTVKHFMSECADLIDVRNKYFGTSSFQEIVLEIPCENVCNFLKEIGIFNQI